MYNELSVRFEKAKKTEADLRAQLHSIRKVMLLLLRVKFIIREICVSKINEMII